MSASPSLPQLCAHSPSLGPFLPICLSGLLPSTPSLSPSPMSLFPLPPLSHTFFVLLFCSFLSLCLSLTQFLLPPPLPLCVCICLGPSVHLSHKPILPSLPGCALLPLRPPTSCSRPEGSLGPFLRRPLCSVPTAHPCRVSWFGLHSAASLRPCRARVTGRRRAGPSPASPLLGQSPPGTPAPEPQPTAASRN